MVHVMMSPMSICPVEWAQRCVRWTACPLYVLDPQLDPAVGGDPDMLGLPATALIPIVGAWRDAFGGDSCAATHTIICAATNERLQALRLVAFDADDAEEAIFDLNPSAFEAMAWRGLLAGLWSQSARRNAPTPKVADADWLVNEAARVLAHEEPGLVVEAANEAVWHRLGLDRSKSRAAGRRSSRPAAWSIRTWQNLEPLKGTATAEAMARELAAATKASQKTRAA